MSVSRGTEREGLWGNAHSAQDLGCGVGTGSDRMVWDELGSGTGSTPTRPNYSV